MSAPVEPGHGRPLPTVLHPNDAALHAIAEARLAAELTRSAVDELRDIAERADAPADLVVVTLKASEPVQSPRRRGRSVTVFNPTAKPVYLGVGGASASASGRSPSCPPTSMLTLPIHVDQIEIAANPADVVAGDLTVYVLFHEARQPAFFGGLP
ncbi:MAG: hypothetical protein ACJ768_09365 [Gaiellaceae bacterium]